MKKVYTLVIIALCLAVVLCACAGENNNGESYIPSSTGDEISSIEPITSETNSQETEKTWYSADDLSSDGVVWVSAINSNNVTDGYSCFDITGKLLFSLEKADIPSTSFVNGVAVINNNRLINKEGVTIWSVENEGRTEGERLFGSGNVESVEMLSFGDENKFFGKVFVQYRIESFEWSGTKTGVLDSDGSWQLEPVEMAETSSFYNGPFYDLMIEETWGCYNILNGEFAPGGHIGEESNEEQVEKWRREYLTSMHSGLMFDYGQNGFIDVDGNLKIDLSKYTLVSYEDDPVFNDGYCFLHIENDQGSNYTTIIDTSGKEMFAPVQEFGHGELSQGLFSIGDTDGTTFFDFGMNEVFKVTSG